MGKPHKGWNFNFPGFAQTQESKLQISLELSFYPGVDGESARKNQITYQYLLFNNIIIIFILYVIV